MDTSEIDPILRAYLEHRESRLAALNSAIADLPQGPVLVMMANGGFSDIFANWVRSCDRAGIEVRDWSLLLAVDDVAARNAQYLGFRVFTDYNSYGEMPRESVRSFANREFRRLMFPKTAIVLDVLELGRDIIFQDVDVVWKHDPRELLLGPEGAHWDARFMYDGENPIHGPLHANTGFFLLRSRPATRRFWSGIVDAYPDMYACGSQQKIINRHLGRSDLAIDILPEEKFSNGHLFSVDAPSRLPAQPCVIHCSWTQNREHKIQKYKLENLWFL